MLALDITHCHAMTLSFGYDEAPGYRSFFLTWYPFSLCNCHFKNNAAIELWFLLDR
jgi:hypothetical protein